MSFRIGQRIKSAGNVCSVLGRAWARSGRGLPCLVSGLPGGGFRSAFGFQILRRSAAGLLSFRFRLSDFLPRCFPFGVVAAPVSVF